MVLNFSIDRFLFFSVFFSTMELCISAKICDWILSLSFYHFVILSPAERGGPSLQGLGRRDGRVSMRTSLGVTLHGQRHQRNAALLSYWRSSHTQTVCKNNQSWRYLDSRRNIHSSRYPFAALRSWFVGPHRSGRVRPWSLSGPEAAPDGLDSVRSRASVLRREALRVDGDSSHTPAPAASFQHRRVRKDRESPED